MKKRFAALAVAACLLGLAPGKAEAHDRVSMSIYIPQTLYALPAPAPAPVVTTYSYYYPVPVVRQRVIYAPAPVYHVGWRNPYYYGPPGHFRHTHWR